MKKVVIFTVLALALTGCFDEKMHENYWIFIKAPSNENTGNPSIIKYDMDNMKKKRYQMQDLLPGISSLEVRDYVYHLKYPVHDCGISLLNNTGGTIQLYAMWELQELSVDGKFVDLRAVWLYAQRGEVVEGLISVDSVFNYLKHTNHKGYFEIPSNGEYFSFQMPDY